MRLRNQLFIAFMLVVGASLGTVALLNYKSIVSSLLFNQRQAMRIQGTSLLAQVADGGISQREWRWLARNAESEQMYVMIIATGIPYPLHSSFPDALTPAQIRGAGYSIVSVAGKRYVTARLVFYVDGTTRWLLLGRQFNALAFTVNLLKELGELLIAGALVATLCSLFLSRRIAVPLIALQTELRKVEERRFSEVKKIVAGGEVGDVAQSVYELSTVVGQYIDTQKQFLRAASHELKTPLMSIQGYIEGIRDGVFKGSAATQGFDIIVSECVRLKKLVNELTLVSKLESDALIYDFQDVSVVHLVTDAVERIQPLLAERNLTITYASALDGFASLRVYIDEEKMLQALINILSNAIRYAAREIVISITKNSEMATMSISDDGPGIAPDVLPYLFRPFAKGKDGQNGLGLLIARAIVEQCGGTVRAYNLPESGAVLEVSFRLSPDQ